MNRNNDPMGRAIMEFAKTGKADTLRVLSSMFDEDEIDVPYLFRTASDMPETERTALSMAEGRVLDVGAGAGCHSLVLQERTNVTAIDISPLSVEAMTMRGVKDARCIDVFDTSLNEQFDTILLLMNGTGIAGKLERMPILLNRLKQLLSDDGQILMDSSDLCYIYEDEDGFIDLTGVEGYYGEVDYQMVYRDTEGERFDWLYIDYETLETIAAGCGLACEKIADGEHYDYLARLKWMRD
ncbi:MAG: methyltransferase domain-containing protein [Prevotella sp.]|nr:methyltransferase domain-containing protein [Prevotella sp.]